MQSIIVPNLQWYTKQSENKKFSPRCPFAAVRKCPRFYQSLSLIGEIGFTKISKKEDNALCKAWQKSHLWPSITEQHSSVNYTNGNFKSVSHFCPEVSFLCFGLFASSLWKYADETDTSHAHAFLSKTKSTSDDWRWIWAEVIPQHYSECEFYSLICGINTNKPEVSEDVIEVKPSFYGISINVRSVIRRFIWWLRVHKVIL